jgi:hypothetical protein
MFGEHEDDIVGDEYFTLSDPLMIALDEIQADSPDMSHEFMAAFLHNIGVSLRDVHEAIAHARREWDL